MGGRDGVAKVWRWGAIVVVVQCAGGCSWLDDTLSDLAHWSPGDLPVHAIARDAGWVAFVLAILMHLASGAFLLWLWRRHGLRAALWLGLYFLVRVAVAWETPVFGSYLHSLPDDIGAFGLYEVEILVLGNVGFALAGTLAFACAAVIAAAECLHVLAARSDAPAPRLLRWLGAAWGHMRPIGCTMLALRLAPSVVVLALYLTGP